jgi:hypothetical protein
MNTPLPDPQLSSTVTAINDALSRYSDQDWNYSRVSLTLESINESESPYALFYDTINTELADAKESLKNLAHELKWGERHSSELGFMELVSLRVNKALLDVTPNNHWHGKRPVVRILPRQELRNKGITYVIGYIVTEVAGEEFDSR